MGVGVALLSACHPASQEELGGEGGCANACLLLGFRPELPADEKGTAILSFDNVQVGSSATLLIRLVGRRANQVTVEIDDDPAFLIERGKEEHDRVEWNVTFFPQAELEYQLPVVFRALGAELRLILKGVGVARSKQLPCLWELEDDSLVFTLLEGGSAGGGEMHQSAAGRVWGHVQGSGPCLVTDVRIEGSPSFSTPFEGTLLTALPGSSFSLPVVFDPPVETAAGVLVFRVNGEEARVNLGTSSEPRCVTVLEGKAEPLVGIGCAPVEIARIENRCATPLREENHRWDAKELEFSLSTLGPREVGALRVSASPAWALDGEGKEHRVLLTFQNGDRIEIQMTPTLDRFEDVYRHETGSWDGLQRQWTLARVPHDFDGDGRLTEEDGIRVWLDGTRQIPEHDYLSRRLWRLHAWTEWFALHRFWPMEPGEWLVLQAPVVCAD